MKCNVSVVGVVLCIFAAQSSQAIEFEKERKEVVKKCIEAANKYRSSTSVSQNTQVTLAAVGVIAGSVAVPAAVASTAAKSTIAALGGLAGAVNGIQYTWSKNGLSAAGRANAYKIFGQEVDRLLSEIPAVIAESSPEYPEAVRKLGKLEFYCLARAPIPEISESTGGDAGSEQAKKAAEGLSEVQRLLLEAESKQGADRALILSRAEAAAAEAKRSAEIASSLSAATKTALEAVSSAVQKANVSEPQPQPETQQPQPQPQPQPKSK